MAQSIDFQRRNDGLSDECQNVRISSIVKVAVRTIRLPSASVRWLRIDLRVASWRVTIHSVPSFCTFDGHTFDDRVYVSYGLSIFVFQTFIFVEIQKTFNICLRTHSLLTGCTRHQCMPVLMDHFTIFSLSLSLPKKRIPFSRSERFPCHSAQFPHECVRNFPYHYDAAAEPKSVECRERKIKIQTHTHTHTPPNTTIEPMMIECWLFVFHIERMQ